MLRREINMNSQLKHIRFARGIEETRKEMGEIIHLTGIKKGAIVVDKEIRHIVKKTIDFVKENLESVSEYHPSRASEAEVEKITSAASEEGIDVVIGIGGGSTIDVAKMCARRLEVDVISFPTLVSHDGIASPVAVLLEENGKKQSLPAKMPVAVVVDLEIIGRAPINSIRAGVGDLLSNFSALEDWKLGVLRTGETCHDLAAVISYSAACSIFEMFDVGNTYLRHPEFIRRLVQGLILSGVAMSLAGSSRPASGSEHSISHAMDAMYALKSYHGEQVALATILTTYLRRGPWEKFLTFSQRMGLPVTATDIGLSDGDYIKAVLKAPDTRKERYTILNEIDLTEADIREAIENISRRLMG